MKPSSARPILMMDATGNIDLLGRVFQIPAAINRER